MNTINASPLTPPAFDLLLVFRHSPYGGSMGREGLEAALAAGAFDQNMAILFLGEAIWQLLSTQQTASNVASDCHSQKNHLKMTNALPLFGIDQIYTSQDDLNDFSLQLEELALSPTALWPSELTALMSNAKTILSF